MPRYQTTGLPPEAAKGHTAFMPHYNRLAASGAQHYKVLKPGSGPAVVHPISNLSATAPSPDLGDIAYMGTARSSDAPNVFVQDDYDPLPAWLPGILVQRYNPTRPQDTTMIPVPAGNAALQLRTRQAMLSYPPPSVGGQGQPWWPRQMTKWVKWRPGMGNG